ncbi:hypothetical protein [Marinospirillum perlucidum]|uniref:hypothetical protein n=1 Tax=Marinospirillum perlucidum TaxID=1982602 RepID=UPI000DF3105F|nr:hypothetical protein [Marinospirillum perlucidum]
MMAAWKSYWSGLEAREQRLLKLGLPVILVLVVYLLWDASVLKPGPSSSPASLDTQALVERLESLQGRLQPRVAMSERRWQALAASQGLQQIRVQAEEDRWILEAVTEQPAKLERFLQAAQERGWYWQAVDLQGSPLQLKVEFVSL